MIKMTDYMAVGKPIVAFDLPEHRFTAGKLPSTCGLTTRWSSPGRLLF